MSTIEVWYNGLQREARSAKKELKNMFKEEALKQHKRQSTPASSILPL